LKNEERATTALNTNDDDKPNEPRRSSTEDVRKFASSPSQVNNINNTQRVIKVDEELDHIEIGSENLNAYRAMSSRLRKQILIAINKNRDETDEKKQPKSATKQDYNKPLSSEKPRMATGGCSGGNSNLRQS
jgi:hypothetical protein